ncbi:hypothetical protein DFH06DRAFT_1312945 [Mycena polygramma]|nr:hypothetical protein DFH06DRAFT_1312945 [Mycena polygramma]
MSQVKSAAEEYFKRDQFPATLLDAREYGYHGLHDADSESSGSDSSTSSNDSDSDDEDSDSGEDKKWKRRFKEKLAAKKKARKTKEAHKEQKSGRNQAPVTREEEERTTKFGKETNEVEEIIERLNTMNIRDPHYGAVYYKALKMDPLRDHNHFNARIRPIWRTSLDNLGMWRPEDLLPSPITFRKESDPTLLDALVVELFGETQTLKDLRCATGITFAVKEPKQSEIECEWEEAEIGENDTSASEEESEEEYSEQETAPEADSEEGSDKDNGFDSDDETGYNTFQVWAPAEIDKPKSADVFEADRTVPTTRAARKLAFDGVMMPPLKPSLKPRVRVSTAPSRPRKEGEGKNPARPPNAKVPEKGGKERTFKHQPPKEKKKATLADIPVQVPFDARPDKPATGKELHDVEMHDVSTRRPHDKPGDAPKPRLDATAPLQHKKARAAPGQAAAARAQAVSDDARRAYDNCMRAPVMSTVGEMMAVSKEIRTLAMDKIKTRAVKAVMMTRDRRAMVAHVAEYPWSEEDGILIKINMEIDGRTVIAVIDTGSQLDVIREGIAEKVLNQPIDLSKSIQMNDANGGEEYLSLKFPLVFDHHRLFPELFTTPLLSLTFHPNFMNELHSATRSSRPRSGTPPLLSQLSPPYSPNEPRRPDSESESASLTLPTEGSAPLDSAPTRLPHFALVTDEASRMAQVQFLNRDTFGEVGPVQRSGQGLTAYQVLYNAAARVREEYRQGEPPESNPLSVTSAQCEYLGVERDPYGREGHAFALLNAGVTGHNPDLGEPFSLNGHAKIILFTPPPAPGIPWAVEAPYPSRNAIQYGLQDFIEPYRPYFAFPVHSTSISPALDYFHPPAPPVHPPGIERPFSRDLLPSPSPNHPRLITCVPAIEADTREIGRAINDRAIAHFASQPPLLFDYIHRQEGESSSDVKSSWEFVGINTVGTRTWRRAKNPGPVAWRRPTLPEHSRLLIPFDDTGVPEVPDDSSDYSSSSSPEPVIPAPPTATVVQIPDPDDRFSRPAARYSVPVHKEEDYDRLARVASAMNRDAREWGPRDIPLNSWQERHIARRNPQPEVLPPDLHPTITAKKPRIIRPAPYSTPEDDISSSDSSDSDSEYLQYYADLGSSDSGDAGSSSDDELLLRPLRPSEEGDSYFPLTLPSLPITPSRDPRRRNPELPGGRPLMSYPSVDALLQRGPNPILPGGRPIFHSTLSTDSMPALQSVSNSSDDEEDDSDRGEELVTAPTPDPWDDNSSEESIHFSSDEEFPLFDSELQYPPSPYPRPVLCLRSPPLYSISAPTSPHLATILSPHEDLPASSPIAIPEDPSEPPFIWTDDQARMSWITRVLNEDECIKRPTSPAALSHTPLLRTLSLSPPSTADSLINLRSTTPIRRSTSPRSTTRVLRRFTHAALTGAEHVLRDITAAVQESPNHADQSYQQLDERIRSLEQVLRLSSISHPPHSAASSSELRDPSTRFPFDEELDEWTTASDQLAEFLADRLKEPRVYRAEVTSTIDTDLLLGFSQGITDERKDYQSLSALPMPSSSSEYSSPPHPPHTPCPSPDYSLQPDPLRMLAPRAESPITEEGQAWVDRIFDFDFDFGSDSSTQDSESAAAHKSIDEDDVAWAPPSRRPMRNECGLITYDRRRYGVVDGMMGDSIWEWGDRRRYEAIGYALEFLDHFVLYSQSHLNDQLLPNLHIRSFNETEQRMRSLEADRVRDQHQRLEFPESYLRSSTTGYREGVHQLPACWSIWPEDGPEDSDDLMGLFLRFLLTVEKEHAIHTPLSPITRSSRYIPIPASTVNDDPSSPEANAAPARRRKVEDSPLSRHVLRAETFKAAIISWQPQFEELRLLRGDVKHGITRLLEFIDFLDLRNSFRAIFFPFTEHFEVSTPGEMFRMEQERNPDGYFRRTSYHHNSLLHDAEVNFFQSCAILFRQEELFDLAYCIEELLTTRFQDDIGIAQLLRDGFLDAQIDDPEAMANQYFGMLPDRLREMIDDWYPASRARTFC